MHDLPDITAFEGIVDRLSKPEAGSEGDPWEAEWTLPLRTAIKRHCIVQQDYRCCYCRRRDLTDDLRVWDLEHIAPRSVFPHFTFELRNLAVACTDCNREKGDFANLRRTRRRYPTDGAPFKMVHPHFDEWKNHIVKVRSLYLPNDAKGRITIYQCNLLRYIEKYANLQEIADERFEAEVADLDDSSKSRVAMTKIHDAIRAI